MSRRIETKITFDVFLLRGGAAFLRFRRRLLCLPAVPSLRLVRGGACPVPARFACLQCQPFGWCAMARGGGRLVPTCSAFLRPRDFSWSAWCLPGARLFGNCREPSGAVGNRREPSVRFSRARGQPATVGSKIKQKHRENEPSVQPSVQRRPTSNRRQPSATADNRRQPPTAADSRRQPSTAVSCGPFSSVTVLQVVVLWHLGLRGRFCPCAVLAPVRMHLPAVAAWPGPAVHF